jgi:hypothetical protein
VLKLRCDFAKAFPPVIALERNAESIPLKLLFEHDLFGTPVATFPDHAGVDDARFQRWPQGSVQKLQL